jgi:hypothetical protein
MKEEKLLETKPKIDLPWQGDEELSHEGLCRF